MLNFLKIKYFLEVAELKSFTKAAERNYISQTAVSQQISALERELKVRLFDREKGKVELTKAGESFCMDCKEITEAYNKAICQARRIFSESLERQTVTIGYLGSSVIEYLDDILTEFNRRSGGQHLDVKPVQENFQSQRQNIKNGTLDMAIGPTFNFEGLENVRSFELYTQKVGLLVSRKSPLASFDSVRISDIRDAPVVMTAPLYSGASIDLFFQHRAEEGFIPRIVEWADSAEMQIILVGMNKGVTYLPEKLAKYDNARCKMLPIEDTEDTLNISLAWNENFDIGRMRAFIDLLIEFFDKDVDNWIKAYWGKH